MGQFTLAGNPPIDVTLRRSARARRLSLRLSRLDGRVTLTVPRNASMREARAFAAEKEAWLRAHLADQPAQIDVGIGAVLPVHGQSRRIEPHKGRGIRLEDEVILVPGDPGRAGSRLQGWIKAQARDRLAAACDTYAGRLGRDFARITLRDTRSRWGSCTSEGALMFSWRLLMAPPEVLDYVAAHEVAHLAEMNHSQRFWDTVTDLYGDWSTPRAWLRTDGPGLHAYRF